MPKKLKRMGIKYKGKVFKNQKTNFLINKALEKKEGLLSSYGSLTIKTGKYTGRSPNDRYIVDDEFSHSRVYWGKVNVPISEEIFNKFYKGMIKYLSNQEELFVFDGMAGADLLHALQVRVINELAWQNLFAKHMFRRPTNKQLQTHKPDFTLLIVPSYKADPKKDKTNSEAFIIINLGKQIALIGGTHYAGEIKKAIFSVMNFILPQKGVLPMHCSANLNKEDNKSALFFGLSGTGKTTLSADPKRQLIGDDEHGWSKNGIFNFEGGCYAKCINLNPKHEPHIFKAIKYGAICENVVMDKDTLDYDFSDSSLTENTRVAYPLEHIPTHVASGKGPHPKTIIFLTADAFGVLPPIAKLDTYAAMYHFLSGYTSKLAGTERGITEPQATFSTLFGEPFMPLDPLIYAKLFQDYINKYKPNVFLINTGWIGGAYGVGNRIKIPYTRTMVTAALDGLLENIPLRHDEIFKLEVPQKIPDVPSKILNPAKLWKDKRSFVNKAKKLAGLFKKNFARFTNASVKVKNAGPQ